MVEDRSLVVVTGGAGFIGSHTVEALATRGYRVVVIDNFYSGSIENLLRARSRWIEILDVDVSDFSTLYEKIKHIARSSDIIGIIHLAAIVNIWEAFENPELVFRVNIVGTFNILEVARRLDIERIVYSSSVAVYGEPEYLPIDEDHPLKPDNLYGESKLVGERLLYSYIRYYSLSGVALRYFNVYGPRMRPGLYAGVVYKFIEALSSRQKPVIYGDGEQTRDFIFVEDVVSANLRALNSNYNGSLNIGTGVETSINNLYREICSIISYCPEPEYKPPRLGDVRRSRASIKLATRELGWRPKTSLREGLEKTIEYYLGSTQ